MQFGDTDDDGVLHFVSSAGPCIGSTNQLFNWTYDATCAECGTSGCSECSSLSFADPTFIFKLYAGEIADDNQVFGTWGGSEITDEPYFGYTESGALIMYRDPDGPVAYLQDGQFSVKAEYLSWLSDYSQAAYQWTILSTLGLLELQIDCGEQHVIQDLTKLSVQVDGSPADQMHWKCAEVVGLGACFEKTSVEMSELDNLESLKHVEVDCGDGHAMQSLKCEHDVSSQAIRFRATCCLVMSLPVTLAPQGIRDHDIAWEDGIYCPQSVDYSGRPSFQQHLGFHSQENFTGNLTYDRKTGQWCLLLVDGDKSCVQNDAVHPLALETKFAYSSTTSKDGPPQARSFGCVVTKSSCTKRCLF